MEKVNLKAAKTQSNDWNALSKQKTGTDTGGTQYEHRSACTASKKDLFTWSLGSNLDKGG